MSSLGARVTRGSSPVPSPVSGDFSSVVVDGLGDSNNSNSNVRSPSPSPRSSVNDDLFVPAEQSSSSDSKRLPAFKGAPPKLTLEPEEVVSLKANKAVYQKIEGGGLVVFRVAASPQKTWDTIRDYPSYQKWIPEVQACTESRKEGDSPDVFRLEFKMKKFFFPFSYDVVHRLNEQEKWTTWVLDYDKVSFSLKDSVGYWRVTPVGGDDQASQVEYYIDMRLHPLVPGILKSFLQNRGLEDATKWVKKQSEASEKK